MTIAGMNDTKQCKSNIISLVFELLLCLPALLSLDIQLHVVKLINFSIFQKYIHKKSPDSNVGYI